MTAKITVEYLEFECPKCTGQRFETADDGSAAMCAGCGAEMSVSDLKDANELRVRAERARKMKAQMGL
jgi:hypothetical protein